MKLLSNWYKFVLLQIIIVFGLVETLSAQVLVENQNQNYIINAWGFTGPWSTDISQYMDGSLNPILGNDPCAPASCYGKFGQINSNTGFVIDFINPKKISNIVFKGLQSGEVWQINTFKGYQTHNGNGQPIPFSYTIETAQTNLGPWVVVANGSANVISPIDLSSNIINKTSRFWKITFGAPGANYYNYSNTICLSAPSICVPPESTGLTFREIQWYELDKITSSEPNPLNDVQCTTLTSTVLGESYLWYPGGQTTQSINVCNSGIYTCQVTNTSYLGNQDNTSSIAVSKLGSQDNWVGPNGEVYTIYQTGNNVYYGGDFNAVGPITGSGAKINESTAAANITLPRVQGTIKVIIPDSMGGWYIGGNFNRVGNYAITNFAHISPTGSVDTGFKPNPNGEIYALYSSGSSLYIGGNFTTLQGLSNNYIAKIDKQSGTPMFWNANANGIVRTIDIYNDKLIVGGDFTNIGGAARNYLAALDTTYVQATIWTPNPNNIIMKVFVNNNKLYVGGDFTSISGVSKSRGAGYTLPGFTIDGYDFGANNRIHDFAFNNNVLYVAGNFTIIGGASRNYLAGLNFLNMIATNFNANADGVVQAIRVWNGNLITGGDFSNIGGSPRNRLASLNLTTGVANAWNPNIVGLKGTTSNILSIAPILNDVYVGGTFWSVGASVRNNIAAVDAITGTLLPFDVNANNIVRAIYADSTYVYLGGDFTSVNSSIIKNRVAQVNANTGIATGWNPNADGSIFALSKSGNNLFVGGSFSNIGGAARNRLACINVSTGGALGFNPNPNGNINGMAISGDSIFVGGAFTSIAGQTRNRVAGFQISTGSILSTNPNANNVVNALALKDNNLYIGGNFTTLGNKGYNYLASYNIVGDSISDFNPWLATTAGVKTVVTIDSALYYGGFTRQPNSGQPILNAGTFKPLSNTLGYWMPQPDDTVRAIYIGPDRSYIGGKFKIIQSRYQPFFATVDLYNSGNPPTIASISSNSLCLNDTLVVNGTNFNYLTSVKIGNTNMPYVVVSSTQIKVVATNIVNGFLTISNTLGDALSLQSIGVNPSPNIVLLNNPITSCAGLPVQLNASGGISYQWNPGNLSGTPTVTPQVNSSYTVIATGANGCTSSAIQMVVVDSLPTVNVGASQVTICLGSSTILNASGGVSYVWQPGNLSGTPTVSPSTSTIYTVTATNANGCSNTATKSIIVNSLPTVIISANPASVCLGSSTTLSATGGVSYTWQPGNLSGTPTVSPNLTTIYTVTTVSVNGCSNTATQTIVVNPLPWVSTLAGPSSICLGASSNLNAMGGVTYLWQPGNLSGSPVSVSPNVTTVYTVTVTNAEGCTKTGTTMVSIELVTVNTSAIPASICAGSSSTLSATGGLGYIWQPGGLSGSPSVSPLASTIYTVTATNANGCTNTATQILVVNQPTPLYATANPSSICANSLSTLNATGGISYTWQPGNLTGSPSVMPFITTTYTVTATNVQGCTNTATTTVVVNYTPIYASASSAVICLGGSTTLSATGGGSYSWQPGNLTGSPTVSPNVTTTYTVTATNVNNGCNTSVITVTVNPLPNVSASANQSVICFGESVTLSASGGNVFNWQPVNLTVNTNIIVTPTVSTIYTVTTAGVGGCTNTNTILITVNPLPTVSATANPSSICIGASSVLSATGGTSYTWQPGGLTGSPNVSPNVTTTYTVTVINANGCSNTATQTVVVNPLPSVSSTANPSSICLGASSVLSATGGISYTWQLGGLTGSPSVSPNVTTTYTVTAINANGCSNTATQTVMVNSLPTVSVSANPSSICVGASSLLSATGGVSYTWQPGGLTGSPSVSPNVTTTYTVTAINANGCSNTATQTLVVNPLPTVSASANPSSICIGASSVLSATGGTSYTWQPGGLTGSPSVSPNVSTTYTVTAINANGCSNTATQMIVVNPLPTVSATANPSSICLGASSVLSATGGTSYTWQPGGLTGSPSVSPNVSTTYTVTAINANGCSNTATQMIVVNSLPIISASANPSSICIGGSAILSASGGANYIWQPGGLTGSPSVTPSVTTTFTVVTVDANGCSNSASQTIVVNSLPTISASAIPSSICIGASSLLSATGGTSYTWQPGGLIGSPIVSPTTNTTYTVTGINANGCSNTATQTVVVNPLPLVSANAIPSTICVGVASVLSATGGASYTWQPGGLTGNPSVSPNLTTTYTVTAIDANGCSNTASQTVVVNSLPTVSTTANPSSICIGASSVLSATGGASYTWQPGGLTGSPSVSPTITTIYTVTALNANGCSNTATQTVVINSLPTVSSTANPSSICLGASSILSATGGASYTWQPGNLTGSPTVTPNTTTLFTVTVIDAVGCTNTATITVTINPNPIITVSPIDQTVSSGGNAQFVVQSSTPGVTYQWQRNTGSGFANLNNGGIISGATSAALTILGVNWPDNGHTFRCIISLANCFDTSTAAKLTIQGASGIDNNKLISPVSVYPNPANTTLHIHCAPEALGSQIHIRDLSGRICYSNNLVNENTTIPVAAWARGLYMLNVISTKGNWVYRIVLSD